MRTSPPAAPTPETRATPLGPIPGFTKPPGRRWYRRWSLWIAIVVALVAASVISDLPTAQNPRQQATALGEVVRQIATDVHPCAYAVSEAFKTFYVPSRNGTLSKTTRGFARQYLNEDQQACSFESTSIFSMSTITLPNSAAGGRLSDLIKVVYEWSTSDANGAVLDIQTLVNRPTNRKALADLATRERLLASDRAKAERDLRLAEADLKGNALPGIGLPRLPAPGSSS